MNAVAVSFVALVAMVTGAAPPGGAPDASPASAAALIAQGNLAMRAGKADQAADKFAAAAASLSHDGRPVQPDDSSVAAQAAYNEGCAKAELGQLPEAEKLFERADQTAGSALSGMARFNLGHARFTRAMAAADKDPAGAVETLKSAGAAFGAAVGVDPKDGQAARALEVTRRQIKRLTDQMEQQRQKQQEQQRQAQQNSDKLKDLADRQQKLADQSEQAQKQSDPEEAARESDRLKQEQSKLNEDTSKAADHMKPEKSDKDAQEAAAQIKQAMEQQKQAEKDLAGGQPQEAQPKQSDAAERLRQAAEAMGKSAQQKGGGQQDAQDQAKQDQQKQDQAKKNAQPKEQGKAQPKQDPAVAQLLDKERREREARERRLRQTTGGIQPVDKDW